MLFPTTVFAVFFLVVYGGHLLLRRRRTAWSVWMLIASYVFYGYWDWRFTGLLAGATVLNHGLARLVHGSRNARGRRVWLALAVTADLGALGFFKYYGFGVESVYRAAAWLGLSPRLPLLDIVLPVGISFFTFQAMSYVIDVYRKRLAPAPDMLTFGVYLAFFPQLVAGPIVRAGVFLPQLLERDPDAPVDTGRAMTLILSGLFKKTVLAHLLAERIVDPVYGAVTGQTGADVLLATYAYAVQIYCDFSAYSDIAIGIALLLGFRFPLNFDAPYTATSLREFWQRWHISLSTWLRDYLYIPLGGSRGGAGRTARNVALVFLLGGLWHGADWRFVVWGGYHGLLLALERLVAAWRAGRAGPDIGKRAGGGSRLRRFLLQVWVFHAVCLSWVFFRAETFEDAWILLRSMATPGWPTHASFLLLLVMVAGLASQIFDGYRLGGVWAWINRRSFLLQGLLAAIILTIVLALGPRGIAPFIYFQF